MDCSRALGLSLGSGISGRYTVLPLSLLLALALAVPPAAWSAERPGSAPRGIPGLYVVGHLSDGGPPEIVTARVVTLRSRPRSEPVESFERLLGRVVEGRALALELVGPDGTVLFRSLVPLETAVRGELHGHEVQPGRWSIERFDVPLTAPVFVARIPYEPESTLEIGTAAGVLRFPVETLLASTAAPAMESHVLEPQASPLPDNRVDLLLMGDGYRASEAQKFAADADSIASQFFSISPYSSYANYVRIHTLFTPSQGSGADHPPYSASCPAFDPSCCSDPAAQGDPSAGQFVNTAFDARYCLNGIHRLIGVDYAAVFSAAQAVPDWDQILLIVNDPVYGGAGGSIAVSSLAPSAVDVARHEYGHSFTGLADEYESAYPGYPLCSDVTSPPCEANVTDETSPALIKWAPWIAPATPIPTPEGDPDYAHAVGLFEGARYRSSGMYRPRDSQCLMRFLGQPFCEVCAQAYVLELYSGDWGSPAGGIRTIEPGLERPGTASFRKCAADVPFSVVTLSPQSGPAPSIQWSVEGAPVPGATSPTFLYSSTTPGSQVVEVAVTDETPLVHPDMELGRLTSTHGWTVETVSLPTSLTLQDQTVAGTEVQEACDTITAGPSFVVTSTGDSTLRAGSRVVLRDGFRVEAGGKLVIGAGPVFP